LIVERIEQGSSSEGKKVVGSDNCDDYIKLKNENEKLKKDLKKASTTNTIVIENLDNDHDMALENEILREENKRLNMEMGLKKQTTNESLIEKNKKLKSVKEHLKTGLSKFIRGQYLQSELLMNTMIKMNRSGIGYLAHQEKKAQAQHQQQYNTSQSLSQRDALSVDKMVTLLMSVKLHHHNPCPSMLDPLLSMLTT
jgi:hypothetical protein